MRNSVLALVLLLSYASLPVAARTQVAAHTGSPAPVALSVRVGEHSDHTRFVLELSDPVKLRVFTLANPNRVFLDKPELLWRFEASDKPSGKGAVKAYRYGVFRPGESRFIIDLN